jgi:hypothetical protein
VDKDIVLLEVPYFLKVSKEEHVLLMGEIVLQL